MNELVLAAVTWLMVNGAPIPAKPFPTMQYCNMTPFYAQVGANMGTHVIYGTYSEKRNAICIDPGVWVEGKHGFAVVIHEVAHWTGEDEDGARKWQRMYEESL